MFLCDLTKESNPGIPNAKSGRSRRRRLVRNPNSIRARTNQARAESVIQRFPNFFVCGRRKLVKQISRHTGDAICSNCCQMGSQATARVEMNFFCLEITTCVGKNLWKSLDAAPNDADHQKEVIISLAVICNATRDLQQLLTITSWQHFLDFGRKFVST